MTNLQELATKFTLPIDIEASMIQRLQQQRDTILTLAHQHGAYNVRVFGSVARGQARPESDIDFLVNVKPIHSAWFPAGLVLDLEKLLGRKIDVVTEEALHAAIRSQILKEAVPL